MLLEMDSVGLEYERNFVEQAAKSIRHIEQSYHDRKLGKAICLRGDSRDLRFLFNRKYSTIVFSSPFANALDGTKHSVESGMKSYERIAMDKNLPKAYTLEDNGNIGNISTYGEVNSILFSPPYGEQHGKGGSIFNADGSVTAKFRGKFASSRIPRKGFLDASSRDNIDNIPYDRLLPAGQTQKLCNSLGTVVILRGERSGSRTTLRTNSETVKLPRAVIQEMYRATVRFAEVLETLEVLLDKRTMRRIKLAESEYRLKRYVVAKGIREIRRILST